MKYSIERICWCPSTFNGYEDSPYWKITFLGYVIGLTDDGKYWGIGDIKLSVAVPEYVKEMLNRIITECKLQIVLED